MPDPTRTPHKRPGRLTLDQYVDGIRAGDRMILARAITLMESDLAADNELAAAVLQAILPLAGNSRRIGITGVPGAGKSTFIDRLGMHLIHDRGERVAVLTVDPSSPVTGGSILGDKTRMERLFLEDQAFIRPSAARGHLGGVARRTRETMLLCEAAGYQDIIVETVGVGQSETAVRAMTDFFLLLLIPGAGDELQGIKRGIIEAADGIAVNKADGDNLPKADRARIEYESALHLFMTPPDGWKTRVVTCSALTGEGIAEIWETILEHRCQLEASGAFAERRARQALDWMQELVMLELHQEFQSHPAVARRLPELKKAVREGKLSPLAASRELLGLFHAGAITAVI